MITRRCEHTGNKSLFSKYLIEEHVRLLQTLPRLHPHCDFVGFKNRRWWFFFPRFGRNKSRSFARAPHETASSAFLTSPSSFYLLLLCGHFLSVSRILLQRCSISDPNAAVTAEQNMPNLSASFMLVSIIGMPYCLRYPICFSQTFTQDAHVSLYIP